MKTRIFLFLAIFSFPLFGQEESITLNNEGQNLQDLVPVNWRILKKAKGDLNNDGLEDLVFAIQNTDSTNIKTNEGFGADWVDLNPRVLGIYFGTNSGGFTKKLQSNDFIIKKERPTMDEPLSSIYIDKNGILMIRFHFWFSAGTSGTSNRTYKFRFHENAFKLIGYDAYHANRMTTETTEYSINFLSERMKISKGSYTLNEPQSVEWKSFDLKELKTIRGMGEPFDWEFEGLRL